MQAVHVTDLESFAPFAVSNMVTALQWQSHCLEMWRDASMSHMTAAHSNDAEPLQTTSCLTCLRVIKLVH